MSHSGLHHIGKHRGKLMASKPQAGVEQSIIVFGGEGELEILLTDTGNARRLKKNVATTAAFALKKKFGTSGMTSLVCGVKTH